jgi:site-specific DNA-methyltransferase (adenine-specific)
MGKSWDSTGIAYNVELWKECLRVLKPGGHLLAFGGTRTYHRMACAIEDAGFEIRDCIMWIYGSGMPKSHDISKAIDKKLGAKREVIGVDEVFLRRNPNNTGVGRIVTKSDGTTLDGRKTPYKKSEHAGSITAPATPEAKQWEGWGTALKPANEPIVLARKPLSEKTIAENVMKWGTGGLNIDGCRVGTEQMGGYVVKSSLGRRTSEGGEHKDFIATSTTGRFPANVILDEEAAQLLDEQSGGSISRFFYCAKASKNERGEGNNHPTVKPTKLIEYLVTLITPPNGIVLDPFIGSGTTAIASLNTGRSFIGIELNEGYVEIARRRVASHTAQQEMKFA